jgi:hypothetical protein
MGDAGDPQASHRPLDASIDAPSPTQQQRTEKPPPTTEQSSADWHTLIDALINVESDLKKEEETPARAATRASLAQAISQAQSLWRAANRGPVAVDTRLNRIENSQNRIENTLDRIAKRDPPARGARGSTWAHVAAYSPAARRPIATNASSRRTTIRIRMEGAKDRSPNEILTEAKKHLTDALAVRPLRSGDIDVIVPDQATKDRLLNLPETPGIKILRQSYLIEVPGVPLSLQIASGKDADNTLVIRNLIKSTKKTIPDLAIDHVRWLHAPDSQPNRGGIAKTRGSLIVTLPTQALQTQAVRNGLIIDSQLYEVRLYAHSCQVKQCFNCGQWGHTQSACGRDSKCSQCAGSHPTKECPTERVACINCGKKHRAWQRASCPTFQAYYSGIQARRVDLHRDSNSIRNAAYSQPSLQSDGFTIVQGKKRARQVTPSGTTPTPTPPPKKGPGRPRKLSEASRHPQQTRLRISQTVDDSQADRMDESTHSGPGTIPPDTEPPILIPSSNPVSTLPSTYTSIGPPATDISSDEF